MRTGKGLKAMGEGSAKACGRQNDVLMGTERRGLCRRVGGYESESFDIKETTISLST